MRATARRPDNGGAVELHIEGITPNAPAVASAGAGVKEPTPEELLAASLASCTATTMELYARGKGWEVGEVEVDVDYIPAQRGSPTRCTVVVRLPAHLPADRRERLMQVGATSQVHRTLDGEIVFEERVQLTTAPKAGPPAHGSRPARRRIAILNGLRGALRAPPA